MLGIITAAPNLTHFQFFENLTPYLKFLSGTAAPFLKEFSTLFSSQGGSILVAIALFFIIFALTPFVNIFNPKRIHISF